MMGLTIAIHQPNYLPWMGYFYKMLKSDVFVLLDNVQCPKSSPAARNYIKGKDGKKVLLSVSVNRSAGAFQTYHNLAISYQNNWHQKHLNHIRDAYAKAPYFHEIIPELEMILKTPYQTLSELNIACIHWMKGKLNLKTRIEIASQHDKGDWGNQTNRNASICAYFGGSRYLSGLGGKKYNEEKVFNELGIQLVYSDFTHPIYDQMKTDFVPELSLIDAFFNLGYEQTQKLLLGKKT
ncbi:MAG: WbqC family protein [Bacteroidota bacterium]|jgi:hypothetical protein